LGDREEDNIKVAFKETECVYGVDSAGSGYIKSRAIS
jgi:hypothetical protein